MKLISALGVASAMVGGSFLLPGPAATAAGVHCASESGIDITVVDGRTACRAVTDTIGQARAAGFDGVGYANATLGAIALGIGAAGGVGASEGVGGIPIAIGLGPDAIALTTLSGENLTGDTFGVSIAVNGSRAQVSTAENTVVCLGSGAFAWNSATGASCLATPFGLRV
ncbi:DUF6764 family protein [Nocardia sp. NPDC051832]|uniref:DUF6764 family protein n=1 Tax=Nocardia sp. NPDC051832 TaxID=3155673 RepID=UPI003417D0B8